MNVECDQPTLEELESGFRFNDAILRSMTLLQKHAETEPSPIAIATAEGNKQAETKAKDLAAKEAAVTDELDMDDIDEEFDANESIPE